MAEHRQIRLACDCPCGMVGCSHPDCYAWFGYTQADFDQHTASRPDPATDTAAPGEGSES